MTRTILVTTVLISFVCLGFVAVNDDPKRKLAVVADEYRNYTQFYDISQIIVTDSSKYKWTVALCIRPKNFDMGWHYKRDSLFVSKADSVDSPHGNKLYRLFIKYYEEYRMPYKPQPVGQVIVKETWNVREVVYDSTNKSIPQIQSSNDGKWYTPTSVSDLFIMQKEKETPDNDSGWVYGIVDIENKKQEPVVLFNGKISTCMKCHMETKYDRIFGVK